MRAKIDMDDRLTLPRDVVDALGNPTHFELEVRDGHLVLTPEQLLDADAVRRDLEARGIGPDDVRDAITWARAQD